MCRVILCSVQCVVFLASFGVVWYGVRLCCVLLPVKFVDYWGQMTMCLFPLSLAQIIVLFFLFILYKQGWKTQPGAKISFLNEVFKMYHVKVCCFGSTEKCFISCVLSIKIVASRYTI